MYVFNFTSYLLIHISDFIILFDIVYIVLVADVLSFSPVLTIFLFDITPLFSEKDFPRKFALQMQR